MFSVSDAVDDLKWPVDGIQTRNPTRNKLLESTIARPRPDTITNAHHACHGCPCPSQHQRSLYGKRTTGVSQNRYNGKPVRFPETGAPIITSPLRINWSAKVATPNIPVSHSEARTTDSDTEFTDADHGWLPRDSETPPSVICFFVCGLVCHECVYFRGDKLSLIIQPVNLMRRRSANRLYAPTYYTCQCWNPLELYWSGLTRAIDSSVTKAILLYKTPNHIFKSINGY